MKWIKYLPIPLSIAVVLFVSATVFLVVKNKKLPQNEKPVSIIETTLPEGKPLFGSPSIVKAATSGDEIVRYEYAGVVEEPVVREDDGYSFKVKITPLKREPVVIKFVTPGIILSATVRSRSDNRASYKMGTMSGAGKPIFSLPDDGYFMEIDREIKVGREVKVSVWFYPQEALNKMTESCCSLAYRQTLNNLTNSDFIRLADEVFLRYNAGVSIVNGTTVLPAAGIDIITD